MSAMCRGTCPNTFENTGTTTLRYVELWKADKFSEVSLAQWLTFPPYEFVRANLKIDKPVLVKVSAKEDTSGNRLTLNRSPQIPSTETMARGWAQHIEVRETLFTVV
jgi:hypothetical protein